MKGLGGLDRRGDDFNSEIVNLEAVSRGKYLFANSFVRSNVFDG